jgi:DNA-binding transcriptional regulator YiaG
MTDFREHLERLGLTQQAAARWLHVTDRSIRRWANPESGFPAPRPVMLLLAVMERYRLKPSQVDRLLDA